MNLIKTISLLLFPTLLNAQETFKEYPVYRVLIAIESQKDLQSGHERYKIGDIIDARPERKYINGLGKKEVDKFIAIRIQGFSRDVLDSLSISVEDTAIGVQYQKRRFKIRFEDLKRQWASFDTTQIHVLDDDLNFILKNGLFEAGGLIWDKKYMRYWR